MKPDLKEFIKVANQQSVGKGTSESAALYSRQNKGVKSGLKIEISFGVGRASSVPWIAFLGFNQTVKNGIYPVYLYYRELNVLFLAFGVSETHKPKLNWSNLNSSKTIKEYIEKKYSKKLKIYGNSFVFKAYDANNLQGDEELEFDLESLIKVYKAQFENKEIENSLSQINEVFSVGAFQKNLREAQLVYSNLLSLRFISSIQTKPFVILTGLSGSGKTKLAQSFVQWVCKDESQYLIIPVGADWTNREPLLGYPNALNANEYIKPDSGALDLILEAIKNTGLPYFLILDEMNLSHVERYFADFLSVMESNKLIPLHSSKEVLNGVPAKLEFPSNLFIIGTVNIDETTHMFSPKVLDRANTIEFRVNKEEMKDFLNKAREIDMKALNGKGTSMAQSFLDMSKDKSLETEIIEKIKETLLQFFDELGKIGAEFGYRSATEMLQLIRNLGFLESEMSLDQKLDIAIIQKLLPKLHGSRRKLVDRLKLLGKFCLKYSLAEKKEFDIEIDVFNKDGYDYFNENVCYPLSLEKISRMYRSAIDNGFASFAEA